MPTHYENLGIDKKANQSEIKKAYRTLSLKYHPDRNSTEEAKTKIQDVNAAYEVLSDPEKKQAYDNELNGVNQHPHHFHNMNAGFNDINSMFNMMFNGGGMNMSMNGNMPNVQIFRNGNRTTHVFTSNTSIGKPPEITKQVEITMEQSYLGITIPVEVDKWVQENNNRRNERITLNLEIPAGITNNENIILRNSGNENQQSKGDIKFIINITNTTLFTRNNLDLIYDKNISLKEALCGFSFEFQHLNGKKMAMNNKDKITIITPGYTQVIQGLGMRKENLIGNLIFKFNIEFPTELTNEQREKISNGLP